ncbi:MAG: bacteriohemerythrin [Desulfovibrionaceae bacterium]
MSLKGRILFPVALLLAIVLGMFVATWTITAAQKDDALLVNLAGRQRMLGQKIAKDALLGVLKPDAGVAPGVRRDMAVFEATQAVLARGGEAPLTLDPAGPTAVLPGPGQDAARLLEQVAARWSDFKADVETALATPARADAPGLAAGSTALLSALDDAVVQLQEDAETKLDVLIAAQAACALVALLAALLVLVTLRRDVVAPILGIRAFAVQVAGGDLKARLSGGYRSELGDLATALERMVAVLVEEAETVRRSSAEAARNAQEAQAAMARCSEDEQSMRTLAESMQRAASQAEGISGHVSGAVDELSHEVEQVNQNVEIQRDRMTETATAMNEMNAAVTEVARNASDAARNAVTSREKAQTGVQGVRSAVESLRGIEGRVLSLKDSMNVFGEQAESIGQVLGVITDIADQTNLLALNAAIEAARAGDAGRGFAVVADEVRKLAEKTMAATRNVGDAIQGIQGQAQQNVQAVEGAASDMVASVRAASEAGDFMQEVLSIVQETSRQVESIATAAEEQSATSEEINRNVSEVTRIASETAEGMGRSAKALMEITGLIGELDAIVQGMAGSGGEGVTSEGRGDLVSWSDGLATGVDRFDGQHKKLIALINELHRAMKERKGDRILLDVVNRLKEYTVTHFSAEEVLFDKHHYPEVEKHKKLHAAFVNKVAEFEAGLRSGKVTVTMDIMRFLKDWLVNHIQKEDHRYGEFFHRLGIR